MRAHLVVVFLAACWSGATVLSGAQSSKPAVALVVADPSAGVFHLVECPKVKGLSAPLLLSPAQAEARKLKAHDCRRAIADAAARPAGGQLVWVDLKTKRYHLAGCSLVGLPRAQMRLDQAAAKYKPCNACKPPSPR